jgi:hypothetical protein
VSFLYRWCDVEQAGEDRFSSNITKRFYFDHPTNCLAVASEVERGFSPAFKRRREAPTTLP